MDSDLFLKFLPIGMVIGGFIWGYSKITNEVKVLRDDLTLHKSDTLTSNDKVLKSIESLKETVIKGNQDQKDAINNTDINYRLHEKDFIALEKRVSDIEKKDVGIEYIGQILSTVLGEESLKTLRRKQS